MSEPILVRVRRAGRIESTHRVHLAVMRADGSLVAAAGDPDVPAYFRSSAKPFQAMPLVATRADALALSDEEVAITCGSHTGAPRHLAVAGGILAKVGLDHHALACGFQWPRDASSEEAVRAGAEKTALYNNCSGKHAGFLALAVSHGHDPADYLRPQHPAQDMILRSVAHWTGAANGGLDLGVDGCSAPTPRLPLRAIAGAWARFASPDADAVARRVRGAMLRHPEMVAGDGRFDTALMRTGAGSIVAKVGAEGVYAVGLVDRGVGLAWKCEDGAFRALPPAVLATLVRAGAVTDAAAQAMPQFRTPDVRNYSDLLVGDIVAEVDASAVPTLA